METLRSESDSAIMVLGTELDVIQLVDREESSLHRGEQVLLFLSNSPNVLRWNAGDLGSGAATGPAGHLRLPAPTPKRGSFCT